MDSKDRVEQVIYCFWTGSNPLTPNRIECLKSMRDNLGIPIKLIKRDELERWILPESPLHKGFQYLSEVHKSDYLRCYFMHHYGGGYADIKFYTKNNNWKASFSLINRNEEIEVVGVQESITGGRRPIYNTKDGADRLISCGYFICKKNTPFTKEWYSRMMKKMDEKYEALKKHPARSPFDRSEEYPMKWVELLGLIFHDLVFETSFLKPYSIRHSLVSGRDATKAYR